MHTVTIKVKSNSFAKTLGRTLKNHREVVSIYIIEDDCEIPLAPMTLQQFKSRIKKSEQSKLLTEEEAITAIKAWKPKRKKS